MCELVETYTHVAFVNVAMVNTTTAIFFAWSMICGASDFRFCLRLLTNSILVLFDFNALLFFSQLGHPPQALVPWMQAAEMKITDVVSSGLRVNAFADSVVCTEHGVC